MDCDARRYLWELHRAADAIATFTSGLDVRTVAATEMIHSAVARKFEIIGESFETALEARPGSGPPYSRRA
jgi:uncharacterized protein with HEPN domain